MTQGQFSGRVKFELSFKNFYLTKTLKKQSTLLFTPSCMEKRWIHTFLNGSCLKRKAKILVKFLSYNRSIGAGCSLEDKPNAMDDTGKYRDSVKKIRASGTT